MIKMRKVEIRKSSIVLALFFALMIILGASFAKANSWDLALGSGARIAKTLLKLLVYSVLIYIGIELLYSCFDWIANKVEYKNHKVLDFIFTKHPRVCIPIILVVVWLPFIVLFYPGMPCNDAITQIRQIYGGYQEVHINIINPDVALNNHHPVLATLILGGFIKFGEWINYVDIGLYLYTLVQMAFLIYTLYYSFRVMEKMRISNIIRAVILAFYALSPLFFVFGLSVVKDVIFSLCIFNYIMMLIEMLIQPEIIKKKSYLLKFVVIMFLCMMYRNNGVYTIILSIPFLMFYLKEHRKSIAVCVMIPLVLYVIINKVVYPAFEISSGSIKEMLSIPFQQTARGLSEGKEYAEEDLEKIAEILDVEEITKNYNPTLSDPVKNTFNKKYAPSQLVDYFKVWGKYLLKYPGTYVEATLNNIYGYFYPGKIGGVGYFGFPEYTKYVTFLGWKDIDTFQGARDVLQKFFKWELKLPVIGTIFSAGFNTYLFLVLGVYTVFVKKSRRYLSIYVALLSILLVCVAAPCFDTRYMLSIIYVIPTLIALSIYISRKEEVGRR